MTRADIIYQIIIYTLVTLITLSCLVPLLYVVGMSFTSEGEMIQKNYFVIIPEQPTTSAYRYVFNQDNFWNSMLISVARTLLGVMAMLIFVVPGGYIMAKHDMPGNKPIMMFFIITMLIQGGLIPGYMLMKDLGLLNTFWVYIVPAFGGVYNMLIVKIFVENIPGDIVESADLDGATELQKMILIAVPLLVPTICALSLFSAVGHWNSWFDGLIYLNTPSMYPLQTFLYMIGTAVTQGSTTTENVEYMREISDRTLRSAQIVIAMVPVLAAYPFLQKYFTKGIVMGSVKG